MDNKIAYILGLAVFQHLVWWPVADLGIELDLGANVYGLIFFFTNASLLKQSSWNSIT